MNDYNELIERCKEILEWKKTGLLKGDALLKYTSRQHYAGQYNDLQIAESCTLAAAAEALIEVAARIAELESRLEISPLHNVDGIMARDATIKLQDERIAELEAERAEREKQKPVTTVENRYNADGKSCHITDDLPAGMKLYAAPPVTEQGCVTVTTDESGRAVAVTRQDDEHRILSVIWEAPVTAPVRLTDRDKDGLAVPYSGMGGIEDYRAYAQDIETAVLRANGFKVEE